MSPEMTEFLRKGLPFMALMSRVTSMLPTQQVVNLWLQLQGKSDLQEALKDSGKIGSYVEVLLWPRKVYGYDILIPFSDRDRSASSFLKLLERYRTNAI
jgi:hypothetical protein